MRMIPLSKGKTARIDDADFDWLSDYRWAARFDGNNWYAYTLINREQIQMHRMILGVTDPKIEVDHRDNDGLNCQRYNLRKCTHAQNLSNRRLFKNNKTGYRGVYPCKYGYTAKIKVDGYLKYLGVFPTITDAARAWDKAARELHGEFARLNFPDAP